MLDKPAGLSSNAALQHAKRLFRARKAGHTGALDPLATGLLPLCFGAATKLSGFLLDAEKTYVVRARLGARTTTGDTEGEVVERSEADGLTQSALEAALPGYTGTVRQRPPMYSALKHQGQRLYALARQGIEVERPEREVTVHALELTGFGDGAFDFRLRCSKGTYVRTLVEDLVASVGQCAHVEALRRTALGPFNDADLVRPETLEVAEGEPIESLDAYLLPPSAALGDWPRIEADPARTFYLSRGQPVRIQGAPARGRVAIMDPGGALLGIGEIDPDGLVAPRRWLA